MSTPKEEADQGYIVPDPSKVAEGNVGDAGDAANEIRFSEEQALIEEQAQGIQPDTYSVPDDEPSMDQARGNLDISDATGSSASDDSSDDGLHAGAQE